MKLSTNLSMRPNSWPHWISLLLSLALIPVLRSLHLPLKFDWITLGTAYWLVLAAQSIFVATLLCAIGLPREQFIGPLLVRYRKNPLRLIVLTLFFAILTWITSWMVALVVSVDAVAVFELQTRQKTHGLRHAAAAILIPATYLFFGFLMVLAYNYAIVSARFNFATDPALAAMDHLLLRGRSVSELAHWAVEAFPLWFFHLLEFIYFGMFPQLGATLILVALCAGKARALRFVGTLLLAYYIALVIFYIWPSQGPYYLCPSHFARFPAVLQCYHLQQRLIQHALALWQHQPTARISTDYFIAMPCMHVVQPMIVLWFVRRWKTMVIALAVYDCLLVAAILMLEQHYVADILVALPVAALATVIGDNPMGDNAAPPNDKIG